MISAFKLHLGIDFCSYNSIFAFIFDAIVCHSVRFGSFGRGALSIKQISHSSAWFSSGQHLLGKMGKAVCFG